MTIAIPSADTARVKSESLPVNSLFFTGTGSQPSLTSTYSCNLLGRPERATAVERGNSLGEDHRREFLGEHYISGGSGG